MVKTITNKKNDLYDLRIHNYQLVLFPLTLARLT